MPCCQTVCQRAKEWTSREGQSIRSTTSTIHCQTDRATKVILGDIESVKAPKRIVDCPGNPLVVEDVVVLEELDGVGLRRFCLHFGWEPEVLEDLDDSFRGFSVSAEDDVVVSAVEVRDVAAGGLEVELGGSDDDNCKEASESLSGVN